MGCRDGDVPGCLRATWRRTSACLLWCVRWVPSASVTAQPVRVRSRLPEGCLRGQHRQAQLRPHDRLCLRGRRRVLLIPSRWSFAGGGWYICNFPLFLYVVFAINRYSYSISLPFGIRFLIPMQCKQRPTLSCGWEQSPIVTA